MSKTLDDLLDKIAGQPLSEKKSKEEIIFFGELKRLRIGDFNEYVQYIMRYNEVQNFKYQS